MTDESRGWAQWRAARRLALPIGAVLGLLLGTLANIIQVLTAGKPSLFGLCLVGAMLWAGSLRLMFQLGRSRQNGGHAMLVDELRALHSGLEGTLGAYRPYDDERLIVFDVGERLEGDTIEEFHTTTPLHGPVVYWCSFEAFTRGPDQILRWIEMGLHVTRPLDARDKPQQAVVVKLQSGPVPRALIAFAPPRNEVTWVAKYVSRGIWDQLRQSGQLFEWTPPSVGPDDTSGRRSPVRKVTFVFRVPAALGALEFTSVPTGVELTEPDGPANGPFREYTVEIANVAALPKSMNGSLDPVRWHLRLKRGVGS